MFLTLALLVLSTSSAEPHSAGVAQFKAGHYAEAIVILTANAATEKEGSPEYKESMLLIGQSYYLLAQAPKAIPWLEKVAGVAEADYMLGYAYIQSGQSVQCEAAFARLFHLDPKSAAGHLLTGQMLLKKIWYSHPKRK